MAVSSTVYLMFLVFVGGFLVVHCPHFFFLLFLKTLMTPELEYGYAWHYTLCLFVCFHYPHFFFFRL